MTELHPYARAFVERDHAALVAMLSDDIVFHSPVINEQAFHGREAVSKLLRIALESVTDLRYTHQASVDGAEIFVADGVVLGKPVKLTNLLELDDDGRIREIWVMARPLAGVVAIAEAIGTGLVERRNPGRGPAIRALSKPMAGMAALSDRIGGKLIADLNREGAR